MVFLYSMGERAWLPVNEKFKLDAGKIAAPGTETRGPVGGHSDNRWATMSQLSGKKEEKKKIQKELDTNLAALTMASARATAEKIRCQEEVNRTNKTIELANRLVKGLETERSWPDSGAAQGPTISPKNQLPYSDHHQFPQLWRSTTLVFKPLRCNGVKNCFRKCSSSLIPPRNKTVDETLQHGNRENQPPDG
ncbi:hypothetical protein MG293_004357 [Ovis ammon polii]|uniref:Dynein heavy chain coiled coil stalk domain-containing protein n=1 Tax=Ovis ammon polii TaxID=230172 RepID=A0AAD4YEZ8_OVIAM|nr:hypothetical protein MG293_004357 [Ovis ammon polii]